MLDAIQAQEDRTQDKLKEKQGVVVRGTKTGKTQGLCISHHHTICGC